MIKFDLNSSLADTEMLDGKPSDFRGIIHVNDAQQIIVLHNTHDCDLIDLFINGRDNDNNCVELHSKVDPGIYEVRFIPWSAETYEGDYDFGIDTVVLKTLYLIPRECLNEMKD